MRRSYSIDVIIRELVTFGSSPDMEMAFSTQDFRHFEEYDWLNRESPEFWKDRIQNMGQTEVEALAKAMVFLERRYRWSGGSVAAIIWIYRYYQERFQDKDHRLADWLLEHSRGGNYYVPFGTNNKGARSVEEYKSIQNWESEQRLIFLEKQAQRKATHKLRKAIRRQEEQKQEWISLAKELARTRYLEWFQSFDDADQLRIMAYDTNHSIESYPAECASFGDQILMELRPVEVEELCKRLANCAHQPWKSLFARLKKLPGGNDEN